MARNLVGCMYAQCYWYDEYDTPSPTDTRTRTARNDSYIRSEHHKDYEKLIITNFVCSRVINVASVRPFVRSFVRSETIPYHPTQSLTRTSTVRLQTLFVQGLFKCGVRASVRASVRPSGNNPVQYEFYPYEYEYTYATILYTICRTRTHRYSYSYHTVYGTSTSSRHGIDIDMDALD